jgi:TrmH family RNA methyltransferase
MSIVATSSSARIRLARSLRTAGGRARADAFCLEGIRFIRDAMVRGGRLRFLICDPGELSARPGGPDLLNDVERSAVVVVTSRVLEGLSEVESSPGAIAVFDLPTEPSPGGHSGILLVLDGVQDPGNLGTAIRSAVGCGVVGAIVCHGGADPYGPKAVRAAAGITIGSPVARVNADGLRDWIRARRVIVASADGRRDFAEFAWRVDDVLAVGSEAAGVGDEIRSCAHAAVAIPLAPGVESLNVGVAASVILFEIARQRRLETDRPGTAVGSRRVPDESKSPTRRRRP